MTEFSGAHNKNVFDGNTLLLECKDNEYVHIFGSQITKFNTNVRNKNYISPIGNNMIPYAIILGEENTYFLYHRYKFIESDKIEEDKLLNRTDNSLDPYDYHVERCGENSFKKLEHSLIRTY